MPVAVSMAFWPSGTVETPIARSLSMSSRARRRRPPHGILIPHIGLPGTTGWGFAGALRARISVPDPLSQLIICGNNSVGLPWLTLSLGYTICLIFDDV